MTTNWRVYDRDTVAARLDRSDLPGFLGKSVVAGINEAAVIVRDGRCVGVVTEARARVDDLIDRILGIFRSGSDLSVYFAELSPFDIELFLGVEEPVAAGRFAAVKSQGGLGGVTAIGSSIGWLDENAEEVGSPIDVARVGVPSVSADGISVPVLCRLRLQVDDGNPANLLALMKGRRAIATWDIAALLREELLVREVNSSIASHGFERLRTTPEVRDSIELQAKESAARLAAEHGMRCVDFRMHWALAKEDAAVFNGRLNTRRESAALFSRSRRALQLRRSSDIERNRLGNLERLRAAQSTGDAATVNLLRRSEVADGGSMGDLRIDDAWIDAQVREIRLRIERCESLNRLEQERAEAEMRLEMDAQRMRESHAARLASVALEDQEMQSMVKMQIERDSSRHEREMAVRRHEADSQYRAMQAGIEERFQRSKMALDDSKARMAMLERLVSQGLSTGQADASVLNTLLREVARSSFSPDVGQDPGFRRSDDRLGKSSPDAVASSGEGLRDAADGWEEVAGPAEDDLVWTLGAVEPASKSGDCGHCGKQLEALWHVCPYCGGKR